ncbi:calmodulin-beta-like [Branchiostoma floridae]|uniref:Calmodulin-beta-like n=1 Tax=Branchiostoma floridae TaxID=7739 RepID=A0A9J7M2Q7_BRAFL|nr:calmodulin-beta-like [Branchiostoma floridae]XP_035692249.1 calmodulin-beta-like [Branchiostoma floridae]
MAAGNPNFDEKQKALFKRCFDMLDKDKDGFLLSRELGKAMTSVGIKPLPSDLALKQSLVAFDLDENNMLDFEEFLNLMFFLKQMMTPDPKFLQETFSKHDKDGNGVLDKEELKEAIKSIGMVHSDKHIDFMVKIADKNGDGVIQYEEFVEIITPKTK